MSSHRDFTPDDDDEEEEEDELLLPTPRQPPADEAPRQNRPGERRRSSVAATGSGGSHLTPAVTSIRLKIGRTGAGGSDNVKGSSRSSTSATTEHAVPSRRKTRESARERYYDTDDDDVVNDDDNQHDDGDDGEQHVPPLEEPRLPSPHNPRPSSLSLSSSSSARAKFSAGSRKRVLSNPSEPGGVGAGQESDTVRQQGDATGARSGGAGASRKRTKLSTFSASGTATATATATGGKKSSKRSSTTSSRLAPLPLPLPISRDSQYYPPATGAGSGTERDGGGGGWSPSSEHTRAVPPLALQPHHHHHHHHHHHDEQEHEGTEEDALLADEISLMAAEAEAGYGGGGGGGGKRSAVRGSSPVRRSAVVVAAAAEGYGMHGRADGDTDGDGYIPTPSTELAERDIGSVPLQGQQQQNPSDASSTAIAAAAAAAVDPKPSRRRQSPESSPEIELVSATYMQRPPPPPPLRNAPSSGTAAAVGAVAPPRKRKAWLKSAKLIPIAPNMGASSSSAAAAAAAGLALGGASPGDQLAYTPSETLPSSYHTVEKRGSKPSKKSRTTAAKSSAAAAAARLLSSPNPESFDGDGNGVLFGGTGRDQRIADDVALDMALLGEGEGEGEDATTMVVKPKKKKAKKLKAGEVGPGKHWRKGVFGPHATRFPGDGGGGGGDMTSELGGDSPNSIAHAGSSHGARLLLPKPARAGDKRRKLLLPSRGGEEEPVPPRYRTQAAGTPDEYGGGGGDDFEHAANASTRSSPEISMRDDPTIGLSRSGMPLHPAPAPVYKPKPLIEGVDGEYIVPKHAAEPEKLGHPVYRNSILTRGISIIRIQDFSGAKAKERELMVPRALKDNLGPQARQFDEGYRVITGVGGARLKLKSWIPCNSPSEYRLERDAKIEEIRLATEAAAQNSELSAMPSRPGLFSSASQRNLSLDAMTPETWLGGNQIHPGQQVRKYSAFVQAGVGDAGVTPPKKPAKKKKKKKVVKSVEELLPEMPSPQLGSQIRSAMPTPDVMLNDPMEGVSIADDDQPAVDQSPYVDDLIMDAV